MRQSGELEHPPQLTRSQLPLIERLRSALDNDEAGGLSDWLAGEGNEPEARGEAEAVGLRTEEGDAGGLL